MVAEMVLDILVTGVSGAQGGSVARALLRGGHRVRGLTSRPTSTAVAELATRGLTVIPGDLADLHAVRVAAFAADGAFLVVELASAADDQVRTAVAAANAIRAAGVRHVVYSSMASCDQHTGIPDFESKYRIECEIRGMSLPYTIVAPVFLMDRPRLADAASGARELAVPLAPDTPLQLIAADDIGAFVAHVLAHQDEFAGTRIEIAGDSITGRQMVDVLATLSGHPVAYRQLPVDPVLMCESVAAMFNWLNNIGHQVDIPALHRNFPMIGWHTFAEWARSSNLRHGGAGESAR